MDIFRYILNNCDFFDKIYEVFVVFWQVWVVLKSAVWETALDSIQLTWGEHKNKSITE